MSARDDLWHWVNEGLKEWGHDSSDDTQANDLIDAYAHELAEGIRNGGCGCACAEVNADRIDPGAGLVRPGEEPK